MQQHNIALVGAGGIGTGVLDHIRKKHDRIAKKYGIDLVVHTVVENVPQRMAELREQGYNVTDSFLHILDKRNIDTVIHATGVEGEEARMSATLKAGKHVVTPNKVAVDQYGPELTAASRNGRACFRFGAAVGGVVPIISPLTGELMANHSDVIMGILNGTTNYILTQMENGMSFDEALQQAITLKYAEPDPTADVTGKDTACKTAIIASLEHRRRVYSGTDIQILEGIATAVDSSGKNFQQTLSAQDLGFLADKGYVVKLLGCVAETPQGLELRVHPAVLPGDHPMAYIKMSRNACYFGGEGTPMNTGEGAGPKPTAAAIMSDVLSIALNPTHYDYFVEDKPQLAPRESMSSHAYLSFSAPMHELKSDIEFMHPHAGRNRKSDITKNPITEAQLDQLRDPKYNLETAIRFAPGIEPKL